MKKIGIIGATGAVGRRMLAEVDRVISEDCRIALFASEKSAGQVFPYREQELVVQAFDPDHVQDFDFLLLSAGSSFSKEYALTLLEKNPRAFCIDNSSAFRMEPGVALVVPEINAQSVQVDAAQPWSRFVANPNCSTIQLVLSMAPLYEEVGIQKVFVATYQSVSGAGQKGMDALQAEMQNYPQEGKAVGSPFDQPILGQLIPYIDVEDKQTGFCFEEIKMIRETQKILADQQLQVFAHTVRVPVAIGHSEAVTLELSKGIDQAELMSLYEQKKDKYALRMVSERGKIRSKSLEFPWLTTVSRLRLQYSPSQKTSPFVQYWNTADNLMVGAATNAVSIMRHLWERSI